MRVKITRLKTEATRVALIKKIGEFTGMSLSESVNWMNSFMRAKIAFVEFAEEQRASRSRD